MIKKLFPIFIVILSLIFSGYSSNDRPPSSKNYFISLANETIYSLPSIVTDFIFDPSKALPVIFNEEPDEDDQPKKIKKVITSFQKDAHNSKESIFELDDEDESYLTHKAQADFTKSPYFLNLSKKHSRFTGIEFNAVLLDVNDITNAVAEYTVHYAIMDTQGEVLEKKSTYFINRLVKTHHHWKIDSIKIQE